MADYNDSARRLAKVRDQENDDNRLGHLNARSNRQLFYANDVRSAYLACGGDDPVVLCQRGAAWWIEQQDELLGGPLVSREQHGYRKTAAYREKEMLSAIGNGSLSYDTLREVMGVSYETVVRTARNLVQKNLLNRTNEGRVILLSRTERQRGGQDATKIDSGWLHLIGEPTIC